MLEFDEKEPIPEDAGLVFEVYRRKPATVFAARVDEDFKVRTATGVITGKAGDQLIVGSYDMNLYPLEAAVFEESYEYAGEKETEKNDPSWKA